jgi:predicted glycoside hydrolase/deacetylase ChbG (UPF0249 family)
LYVTVNRGIGCEKTAPSFFGTLRINCNPSPDPKGSCVQVPSFCLYRSANLKMKSNSYLIINADDFGLCESVNNGIMDCIESGLVTDFSFIIHAGMFEKSHSLLQSKMIRSAGCHINLTLGRSLFINKSSIISDKGNYPSLKRFCIDLMKGKISECDIYEEINNQVLLLKKCNYKITHIDSHRNIHLLPKVMKQLLKVVNDLGLNVGIRMPFEKISLKDNILFKNRIRIESLNFLTKYCEKKTNYHSKIHTIGGNFFANPNGMDVLHKIFNKIKISEGSVFEIAVHPGYKSRILEHYDSYTDQRFCELNILRSSEIKAAMSGLQLTKFSLINKML